MSQIVKYKDPKIARGGGLAGLRRKTVVNFLRAWREVKGTARLAITGEVRSNLPKEDVDYLLKQMRECFKAKGGEVTARAKTAELGRTYLNLDDQARVKFLRLLAEEFDLDRERLDKKIVEIANIKDKHARIEAEYELREALVSSRSVILKRFTSLPNGFKFLVDMRADLMPCTSKDASLRALEYDLKGILSSWFDVGLLDLMQITWNSPAALLEKLIEYESVHIIKSWDDLKNRLDSDRRIYAFIHAKMPMEPLIFVQIAFTDGLADSIQKLLDEACPVTDEYAADTATFYSISNAQRGLAGISFGNFLIKRVVAKLMEEMPHIKNFATLSPVPGFLPWLNVQMEKDEIILDGDEIKAIKMLCGKEPAQQWLRGALDTEWQKDPAIAETVKPVLVRLCAHYLLKEKKPGGQIPAIPLDPVAQFHLFNGARLERINWQADMSERGMQQSAGMMVNYYYKLDDIDDNHEAYVTEGELAASKAVKSLLR